MERETLAEETVFVIRGFLTPEECAGFIRASEGAGYDDAPITSSAGFVMRKDIRNNDRVMVDDPALAGRLFERARPLLVQDWYGGWRLAGFNERWRYYRYNPGQRFALHSDGYYQRDNGERSHFTFMIYLNDGFTGGQTAFYLPGEQRLVVQPEAGMALVFLHQLLHEGTPVESGTKYVLRTDVMYRREPR